MHAGVDLRRSTTLSRTLVGVGAAAVVAGALLAFAPMHGNGLSGNAIRPHYSAFGWYSYKPLPLHPTMADFRRAGITVPKDLVEARRQHVAWVASIGVLAIVGGLVLSRATAATAAKIKPRQ